MRSLFPRTVGVCLVAAACLMFPLYGFTQAWVSPKGTGSLSVSYQNSFVDQHLFGDGQNFVYVNVAGKGQPPVLVQTSNLGQVRFQSTFLDVSYSLTDKLGISASLPFIEAKYTAPSTPVTPGLGPHVLVNPDGTKTIPLDDGRYHGSFQDFDIKVRYMAWTHPFVITPFVEYVQPSHGYMFYSHAVVGSHVRQLNIGTYLGGLLDPLLPNGYIQGRYSYGFPQTIIGVSRRRQNMELEVGYFVNPTIRAFGLVIGEVTKGGVNVPTDVLSFDADRPYGFTTSLNPLFFHHTQISRDNILDIGGGMTYAINDGLDLFGVVTHTITARNMHALKYGITFGMSWGFGGSPQRPCHC
jgi:hypothetical protein